MIITMCIKIYECDRRPVRGRCVVYYINTYRKNSQVTPSPERQSVVFVWCPCRWISVDRLIWLQMKWPATLTWRKYQVVDVGSVGSLLASVYHLLCYYMLFTVNRRNNCKCVASPAISAAFFVSTKIKKYRYKNNSMGGYNLPQQAFPKSRRTNCTMYGSSKLTYHHGTRSDLVNEHVSAV